MRGGEIICPVLPVRRGELVGPVPLVRRGEMICPVPLVRRGELVGPVPLVRGGELVGPAPPMRGGGLVCQVVHQRGVDCLLLPLRHDEVEIIGDFHTTDGRQHSLSLWIIGCKKWGDTNQFPVVTHSQDEQFSLAQVVPPGALVL